MEQLHALNRFMEGKQFQRLHSGLDLSERFRRIRHNYALFQQLVDAGFESWMGTNQYAIGDWVSIFTPIEAATWHDIRCGGLPLWPQLPVDRFFVDFGNPIAKIALECDGAQWHDEAKDARRDAILRDLGWKVWRAPGWRCNRVMERPDDFPEWSPEAQEEFWRQRRAETMLGIIEEIRPYLEME